MKFYITATEVRNYQIIVEAESEEQVEDFIYQNEDYIVATLKDHVTIRDFGEIYLEECEEDNKDTVDFTI